jgi:hypothetical protein
MGAGMNVAVVGVVGVAIYASGILASDDEVLNQSVEATYSQFASMPALPSSGMDLVQMVHPNVSVATDRVPMKSMTWHFRIFGKDYAQYTATISPDEPGKTRVALNFTKLQPELTTKEAQYTPDFKFMQGMARTIASEHVRSQLEHRPYDKKKIAQAFQGQVMANAGGFARTAFAGASASMDEAAAAQDSRSVPISTNGPTQSAAPMIDLSSRR